MKPVIQVENLSKKFRINHAQEPYLSIRDAFRSIFSRTRKEDFYALRDVNFSFQEGDSVGIIGRNGAGKSTLLKIISRITPPTTGKITYRGRVASLLEVGTGFHGELTGRENVFMNGSILGMKRNEIKKNFDAIVEFAGVEKFIDTPLKHFSSGMQLRLAFSVAAFLENEILIVDEVLAVGDADFQKKCLGKMEDVSKSGRTIFFVSHSMTAIQSLCTKVLYMDGGKAEGPMPVPEGISKYLFGNIHLTTGKEEYQDKPESTAYIKQTRLLNAKGEVTNQLLTCEDFYVELTWKNIQGVKVTPTIELVNYDGTKLFWSGDTAKDWNGSAKKEKGTYISTVKIPAHFLKGGEYSFHLALYTQSPYTIHDMVVNTLHCSLTDPMDERCLARGEMTAQFEKFILLPLLEWDYKKVD